jgi:hypothetical protein
VGVGGGHRIEAGLHRQGGQPVVAHRVERVAVVPQLDGQVVAAEGIDQLAEAPAGGDGALVLECGGHRALATAGEHEPVAPVGHGRAGASDAAQVGEGEAGPALLAAELGVADGPGQQRVAAGIAGEHHQVAFVGTGPRVGLPHRHRAAPEGQLAAEDGGQAQLAGRLGHAHHAVEAVVVGDGQRLEAEAGGLLGQGLGRAGAVEEAEVAVAVQLGVGHRAGAAAHRRGRLVGLALARPRRAVAAVAGEHGLATLPGGQGRVTEPLLQLPPGHRRVPPPHGPTLSNICSHAPAEVGGPARRSNCPGARPQRGRAGAGVQVR